MLSEQNTGSAPEPAATLNYEADLCGNIEQALKGLQGYGIMALELIQNADDAGAETLIFDARTDALLVRNDAEFSSCGSLKGRCTWERTGGPDGIRRPCNFHAISRMGSRSKIGAPDQIGRFGIGFVSVYQITDTPIIRSAGTQLRLNPLTGKGVVSPVPPTRGTEFELPWAAEASDIRAELHAPPTPPDVASIVAEEIAATLRSSLLFLRHLRRVEVREDDRLRLGVDIGRDGERVTLDFGQVGQDRWIVLSGDATRIVEARELPTRFEVLETLDRSRTVSVAIPVEAAPIEGRLFAYLPTQHPTGLPLHVNADFFPHASRQEIVLKGESHERYWNEALIATAAGVIGANFARLRDALGGTRLWELGSAALRMRGQGAFGEFWTEFSPAAKAEASVRTTASDWHTPEGAFLALDGMPAPELAAIADLGTPLIDEALRPHFTAMATVGARLLTLSTATTALEGRQGAGISGDNPKIRDLWRAMERLVAANTGQPGSAAIVTRLKAATFLIDVDGVPASPEQLWRLPAGVRPDAIRHHLPDSPIAHGDVATVPGIHALLDEMGLDDLAASLAAAITSDADALVVVGPEPADARRLYSLLLALDAGGGTNAGKTLAGTPFLRTGEGFVPPSRGQMPGHFRDPTGYFELVDTALFPHGMDEFARGTLGVEVLSFHSYIDAHLPAIIQRGPSREQYRDIVGQIVSRKNELDDRGSLGRLRERAFVRTRAGTYARPGDCYYWTAPLATILGDEPANWVDSNWMPPSPLAPQVQDLLEGRLGMPVTVTPRDIVDRLEGLASDGTPDEVADRITPIIRHVLERWPRLAEEDLETFAELRNLQFLPAVVDGKRNPHELYLPEDVYRAARAPGFASQVAVIDLTPLRQANVNVGALLDLLGVQEEPDTAVVVAHLRQCMADCTAPSDLTYAILNERVDADDDVASITALEGSRFIYDHQLKRFLGAGEVFWLPPPFRDFWWQAGGRMGLRTELFNLLGVRSKPAVENYAALMLRIAGGAGLTAQDMDVHSRCFAHLCDAMDAGDASLDDALEKLRSQASLLTVDGEAVWPEDAIWLDSEQVAAPFGRALNTSLVAPPDAARTSAAQLFRRLGVPALSSVARLRLAEEPDQIAAEEDTALLRDRADLILWVAPNAAARSALRGMLRDIEIRHTSALRIRAEIATFDPPVTSPVSGVPAHYEADACTLHVAGASGRTNWAAAFRTLLAEIERLAPLADMKPLVATATLILLSASRDEAEQTLQESGFRAPQAWEETSFGEALDDDDGVAEDAGPDEHEGDGTDEGGADAEAPEDDADPDADHEAEAGDDDGGTNVGGGGGQGTGGGGRSGGDGTDDRAGTTGGDTRGDGGATGDYRSKARTGQFGEAGRSKESSGSGSGGSHSGTPKSGQWKGSDGSRERRARHTPMRSYVAREGDRGPDDGAAGRDGDDIGALVDLAAVKAVIKFEEQRGWLSEEQHHNNPGYDVVSRGPTGERRLIEIKGLENEWTPRGVKLSSVQFGMAERHPDEYWVYVVERARDLGHQRVNAIANPFGKVDEYWFDDGWRGLAEEGAGSQELNVTVGAMVRHQVWGKGRIVYVQNGGIVIKVKVDFGFEGIKLLPFNSSLELLED